MIAEITHRDHHFRVDLNRPIDLSIPLHAGMPQLRAWWLDPVRMEPVEMNGKRYSVGDGAPVNFRNVFFNPHGHGTHTESVGHIAQEILPVGDLFKRYFFTATLITIEPQRQGVERIVTAEQMKDALRVDRPEALVLRTLPNANDKRVRDWSGSNAPYVEAAACTWLRGIGVQHFLLDLPSVDREEDGGALAAHHAFWDHPATTDAQRTITELIHVPDHVPDGDYLLELQLPHFMNDAAPSRPLLYTILR
ncbi:MAG: cyclase family protein [Flavobacteriales bacterium]